MCDVYKQIQILVTKEYLSRVAARVDTNGPAGYEQRNKSIRSNVPRPRL